MRVKDLQTVAEQKKTKPKFQLGRFLWKARVIMCDPGVVSEFSH